MMTGPDPSRPAARTYTAQRHGVWRSLVAHSLWERGAVGSNPATPTVITDVPRTPGVTGWVTHLDSSGAARTRGLPTLN